MFVAIFTRPAGVNGVVQLIPQRDSAWQNVPMLDDMLEHVEPLEVIDLHAEVLAFEDFFLVPMVPRICL